MRYILLIALIGISQIVFSQIKELYPNSTASLHLSIEGEKEFEEFIDACQKVYGKLMDGVKEEDLSPEEKELVDYYDIDNDYWGIIKAKCSWHCEGGPKDVSASSCLKAQADNSYLAENANDNCYKSAWIEGVPGYGIGEYLLYTFSGAAPRINEIIVVNGYVKSETAWKNNSRVKKLKMYIDDKAYAILNFEDIRAEHTFEVEPIGNSDREDIKKLKAKPDWTITFEIMDVYKGLKYDDVAISEIYFNGLDVHCFAKGTKIQLADASTRNIEDIKVGDTIRCLDETAKKINYAKVEKTERVIHSRLVTYRFESGMTITVTQDHPFRISDKGWASLKPKKSKQYKGFGSIDKIEIGDQFMTVDGVEKLVSIDFLKGHQETYTISKLSSGDNFIANGLIVGVEELND